MIYDSFVCTVQWRERTQFMNLWMARCLRRCVGRWMNELFVAINTHTRDHDNARIPHICCCCCFCYAKISTESNIRMKRRRIWWSSLAGTNSMPFHILIQLERFRSLIDFSSNLFEPQSRPFPIIFSFHCSAQSPIFLYFRFEYPISNEIKKFLEYTYFRLIWIHPFPGRRRKKEEIPMPPLLPKYSINIPVDRNDIKDDWWVS